MLFRSVLGRDRRPLLGAEVTVTLSRPSTSAYDRSYPASPRPEGGYLAKVDLPLPGPWKVGTRITHGKEATTFVDRINAR